MSTNSRHYEDYVKERELLIRYEQQAYDNYQKTILTLSSAFLLFSVSFLGIIKRDAGSQPVLLALHSVGLLVWAWISFASSVLLMLLCFAIDAKALRTAVADIEPLADGKAPEKRAGKWNVLCHLLHTLCGVAFAVGVILLLSFCGTNVRLFSGGS